MSFLNAVRPALFASALLALQWGLRTEVAVSIAAPARLLEVLRGMARHLGLPARARAAFIRQVEREVGVPISRLDVAVYQLELPGFIVHAEDDPLVAVSEARLIHQAWFDSQLLLLQYIKQHRMRRHTQAHSI